MEKETIDLYAPHNAKNLTAEHLAAMEHFTKDDVKALAQAYPNSATTSPYLILKEKGVAENKQVYHPSTWHNFYALVRMGTTKYYPISYKSIFKRSNEQNKTAPVQVAKDLTDEQVKEELKKQGSAQTATEDTKPKVEEGGTEKTAEQIAKEEGSGIEGSKSDQVKEKPMNKMNMPELSAKFREVFGEDPEPGSTKGQIIAAIQSKK
jgi:hypothetical protein